MPYRVTFGATSGGTGPELEAAIVNAAGEVVGAARVCCAGSTWEVTSFAVRPGSGQLVYAALWHTLVGALRANRVRTLVMTLDDPTRLALARFDLHFEPLTAGASRVSAQVSRLLDTQRRVNPDAYRLVSLGAGLDGVQLPENDEFILTPLRAGLSWTAPALLAPTG